MSNLNAETLDISDIVWALPEKYMYKFVRRNLIKWLSDSREKQLHRLFKYLKLVDEKLTQLPKDERVFILFIDKSFPSNVRRILPVSGKSDLNLLAEIADKMLKNTENKYVVAVDTRVGTTNALKRKIENLKETW